MALHISVKGHFGSSGRRPVSVLDDPVRVRKDLENERRITRLQQVREKSSDLARKIRQDVAAEKKRQIERLQRTKQDELNVWREHVLAKKNQDYRTAVFEVGTAHRAAQAETERNEKRQQEKNDKINKCRQRAMKRNAGRTQVKLKSTAGVKFNAEGRATTGTQTPMAEAQPQPATEEKEKDKENRETGGGTNHHQSIPKRSCCHDHPHCYCLSSDDDEDCVDFVCESSDSSILHLEDVAPSAEAPNKLKKNPTVILDVNIDDVDCRVINTCTGLDINDRHIQTNRNFSHVVRPTSASSTSPRRPRFTQITDLVKRTEIIVRPVEAPAPAPVEAPAPEEPAPVPAPPSPTKSLPRSPKKAAKAPAVAAAPKRTQPAKKGTKPSQQQAARRTTGLKTDATPAKVIDAGLKRKTLPKAVNTQPPAAKATQQAAAQEGAPPLMQQLPPQMQQPLAMQQAPQMQPPNPQQLAQYPPQQQQQQQAYPPPQQQQHAGYRPAMQQQQQAAYPPPLQQQYPPPPLQQQQAAYAPPLQQQPARYAPPLQQQQQARYASLPLQQQARYPPPPPLQQQQQAAFPPPHSYAAYTQSQAPYPQHSMQPMQPYAMPYPAAPQHAMYAQQQQAMPLPRPPSTAQRSSAAPSTDSTGTFMLRQPTNVHFYDHNNKYHRTYEAPVSSVQLNGPDARQPNAMAQALSENHLRGLREEELEQLRQKCDRRGQRALEREQVRRDCAELTEKLEALSQQQPNLLPSDANFIANHRYADLAARREHKMNEAMEEMLLRPAIVTCPEVAATTTAARAGGRSKQPEANAINLGAQPDRAAGFKGSSESCCSMLLDYVDDQSKQLRSDLRAAESNTTKSLRLKNLLDRVEKIRVQLLEELKAGERSSSQADKDKQVLDGIRQEREDILTEKARTLNERETELVQKEALLEQRLKKFYKEQKQKKSSDIEVNAKDKPVIIIKVNSDGTVKQCKPKPKARSTAIEAAKEPASTDALPATEPQRQNSIDSNSTAYRSLPPISYKNLQPPASATEGPPTQVDPMIAHYIQRLLGMTRRSVQELSVSSSEVPTPEPSIINVSRNMTPEGSVSVAQPEETAADRLRMERVQNFIQDNRSFVNELEDTLRSQQDKESSMQTFDQIWNKRLANKQLPATKEPAKRHKEKAQPRPSSNSRSSPTRKSVTLAPPAKRTSQSAVESQQPPSEVHIERYAQLTENCTHRIAELTELITKVREEKQRLVEVTLTSASEGERLSTEYLELPEGQKESQKQTQRAARSRTISDRSDNTTPSTSEALPLIKHKPTAASRDSGISESRPITALGQVPADAEPAASTQRRARAPPATMRRYSPQLDADELAHELSTIAEVETPGQSHLVAATPLPKPFPNFDDYARELQLDLSHLDADQSQQLKADFDELVQAINQQCGGLNYREFPSINAYLRNVTTTRLHVEETDQGTVTTGELMRQLRLDSVPIEEFPDRRAYMQQLPAEQREMIDTASLEHDSSDSFDVEKELRQRRIIKSTVRRSDGNTEVITTQEVASSTRRESVPPDSTEPPNESGIEQLTGSSLSREFDRELQRIGVHRLSGGRSGTDRSAQDASQIGRSLNLREFLTRELLKHRVDSSDDSLKSSFLHSLVDSLSRSSSPQSPSLGHGTGATTDRQKTSTPRGSFQTVQEKSANGLTTQSVPSASNSQLFSGESRISLINYPDGTPPVPFATAVSCELCG
ncbi:titin [Drosophila subobscura]|uniref:titin n=1 Tax=Drosophila subobscura TaxID=7241 RepID=UPI00155AD303|nr:titin [Drosophila subobscura]